MNSQAWSPVQHDNIARLDIADTWADLDDRARGLMAQKVWKKFVRSFGGGDLVELRATDGRIVDFDQRLSHIERFGQLNLVDDQGVARFRRESQP